MSANLRGCLEARWYDYSDASMSDMSDATNTMKVISGNVAMINREGAVDDETIEISRSGPRENNVRPASEKSAFKMRKKMARRLSNVATLIVAAWRRRL